MKLIHKIFIGSLVTIATNSSSMDVDRSFILHKKNSPTSIELQAIAQNKGIGIVQCDKVKFVKPTAHIEPPLWFAKTFIVDNTFQTNEYLKDMFFDTIIKHIKKEISKNTPSTNSPEAEIRFMPMPGDMNFFQKKGCIKISDGMVKYNIK